MADSLFPIINLTPDENEFKLEVPVPHEFKLNQSINKKKGLSLFAWNPGTGKIKKIDFTDTSYNYNEKITRYKVHQEVGWFYLQALNMKNAKKVVMRWIADIKLQYLRSEGLTHR